MSSGRLNWGWFLIRMSYGAVIMSPGWDTLPFQSHPDEIANFDFHNTRWPFGASVGNHGSPPVARHFDVFFDLRMNKESLCTSIFPDKLRITKVIPLYKKDDKLFGNYHPLSLLSSISKIFERVAFNQPNDYFTSNGLLYESQYGFRKFYFTELAALEFTEWIRQQMDNKKIPFSIFLDLSEAFDNLTIQY